MSKWFEFYVAEVDDNNKMSFLGPYAKIKGKEDYKPIPIYEGGNLIYSSQLNNEFFPLGTHSGFAFDKELDEKIKKCEQDDSFLSYNPYYYLSINELNNVANLDDGKRNGFIKKDVINSYELYLLDNENNYELVGFDEYLYSYSLDDESDNEFVRVSPSIYNTLSDQEKGKYIFYEWKDESNASYFARQILSAYDNLKMRICDFNYDTYKNDNNKYIIMVADY